MGLLTGKALAAQWSLLLALAQVTTFGAYAVRSAVQADHKHFRLQAFGRHAAG
jgi:hypothetical protein